MTQSTLYTSKYGKSFCTESAALNDEKYNDELQQRLKDLSIQDSAELEKLINDLTESRKIAYSPGIIDTMGTVQARALLYMKNVCQKFVDKYKDLRMV